MPFPWSKAIFSSRVISWSTRSARRSGESVLSIHGPCTDGVSASARERPRSKMAMTRIKTTKSSAARNPELTRLGFFACKAITSWLRSLAGPIITLFWLKLRGKIEQAGCPCPLRSSLRSLCSCKFLPAMRMILAAFALLAANHFMSAPPEGIPLALARQLNAEMAFACFYQSDLKGRFRLELPAPENWTAVSNTAIESQSQAGPGRRLTVFSETRPISTYLFAFAAGPFRNVHETPSLPGLYVRQSKFKKAEEEAPEVQQIAAQGIDYLSRFFAEPFPFPKYDMVLIPGFAYGGMEHAGATFLREESVLFRAAPTHSDHLNRDILVLHELTHQWFGDFTTMRWFDDLWLKEDFAQYMAYQTLASIKPNENIWKRFYRSIKPAAYGIDSTKGTTPIYQDIANLKDAKSAYGAIVYSKAPGVLNQLAFVLGEDHFREGLRLYLTEHAYASAEWSDLVRAFEHVSGKPLQDWAAMWIRHRGMPQVDVFWSCDAQNRINHFSLTQKDVLGEGGVWPVGMQILLAYPDRDAIRLRAELNSQRAELEVAIAKPCPQYVFLNDRDYAYGRFLLDDRSRKAVMEQLGGISAVFERTLLWGSLWDSVREAELGPGDFLELALRLLPTESDESLAQSLVGHVAAGMHRYVNPTVRAEMFPRAEMLASDQMLHSPNQDLRFIWFRD